MSDKSLETKNTTSGLSGDRFGVYNDRTYDEKYVSYSDSSTAFSGTEVSIYFNTVWVPEVTSIQFSGKPQDSPVFSYSQENWNALTKGTYMVQGQLTINFKETGYLNKVLRTMWNELAPTTDFDNFKKEVTENDRYQRAVDVLLSKEALQKRFSDVRDAAQTMRDNLWKSKNKDSQFIYRPDQVSSVAMYDDDKRRITPPLNIIIIYGDPNGIHTVKKLSDVRFLECGQNINVDATPIQEVYTFVARDMDNPETVVGFDPFVAPPPKEKKLNLDHFIDYVADSLYKYILQKDSMQIFFDTKFMVRDDSVLCARLENNNQIAMYKGKENICINTFAMFNVPLEYHKKKEIGIYAKNVKNEKTTVRYSCLTDMVKFVASKGDSYENAPANDLTLDYTVSYIAEIINTIGYMNPYAPVRGTRIITHVSPQKSSHIMNGFMNATVLRRTQWYYKERETTELTYAMMPFERFNIFENTLRDEYDFTVNISGDESKAAVIFNRNNRTVFDNFANEQPNILFELLNADAYSPFGHSPELCQTHFSSLYGAKLQTVPGFNTESSDWRGVNCVFMIPEEYSIARQVIKIDPATNNKTTETYQYPIIYDSKKMPMTSGVTPFENVDQNDDHQFLCIKRDPITGEYIQDKWFPIPVALWKSKTDNTVTFGVAVTIDGYPSLYGTDLLVEFDAAKGMFAVKLKKAPVYISESSKITFILIDLERVNPISYKSVLSTYDMENAINTLLDNKTIKRPKDKDNPNSPYIDYSISTQSVKDVHKLRYGKLISSIAIPAYGFTQSTYTKQFIKKYIQSLYVFTDIWQYKFDYQEFFTYLFEDMGLIKKTEEGGLGIGPTDYQQMLERFRLRLLNNLQRHILPYYMDIRLAGRTSNNVIITCQTDKHPASIIESYIKYGINPNTDAMNNKYQNFIINYDTVNVTKKNMKSPILYAVNIPKLLHREYSIAKDIKDGIYPFFFYDNKYTWKRHRYMDDHYSVDNYTPKSYNTFICKPNATYTYKATLTDLLNLSNKNLVKQSTVVGGESSDLMKSFYQLFVSNLQTITGTVDQGNYNVLLYYNTKDKKYMYVITPNSDAIRVSKDGVTNSVQEFAANSASSHTDTGVDSTGKDTKREHKDTILVVEVDDKVQTFVNTALQVTGHDAGIANQTISTSIYGNQTVFVNQSVMTIDGNGMLYDTNIMESTYYTPLGYDSKNHTIDAFDLVYDVNTDTHTSKGGSKTGKIHTSFETDDLFGNIMEVNMLTSFDQDTTTSAGIDISQINGELDLINTALLPTDTYEPAYMLWQQYIDDGLEEIHDMSAESPSDETSNIITATRNILTMMIDLKLLCSYPVT